MINNGNRLSESNTICNHTSDRRNRTTAKRESDLLIIIVWGLVSSATYPKICQTSNQNFLTPFLRERCQELRELFPRSVTTIQRYFYRSSSSCINGLVTPRREVQNILFICHIVWPIPKPLRKIVRKISFQTVVFARNLDERQSRYRHLKIADFTLLLTWTLIYLRNNGIYKGKRTDQTFRC